MKIHTFSRRLASIVSMFMLVVLSVFLLAGCSSAVPSSPEEILKVTSQDWVQGGKNAKVVLIEYADFQCPVCSVYAPLTHQLAQKYPEKFQFVYRYFPLVDNHKNAFSSAKAAQSAGLQGKFFEMSDLLYQNQDEWSEAGDAKTFYLQYAKQLSLDEAKFLKDFESSEVQSRVQYDLDASYALKLDGTPSFFINGKKIQIRAADFIPYVESVIQGTSSN